MPKSTVALLLCSLIVVLAGCAKTQDHQSSDVGSDAKKNPRLNKTSPTTTTSSTTTTTEAPTTTTSSTSSTTTSTMAVAIAIPVTSTTTTSTTTMTIAKAASKPTAPTASASNATPAASQAKTSAPETPAAQAQKEVPTAADAKVKVAGPTPAVAQTQKEGSAAADKVKATEQAAEAGSQVHDDLGAAVTGAMAELQGALNNVNQVLQNGVKPTTSGFPDDKMYPDAELTKVSRALKYPAKGIAAIDVKSRLLRSVQISRTNTDQITIGFVAKADPDMRSRASLLADGIQARVDKGHLVLSDAIAQNQCVQMRDGGSFSMRGSCVTDIAIALPANSSILVLDDKGKTIASEAKGAKPRTFSNPCEQELSVFANVPSFAKLCGLLETKESAADFKNCVVQAAKKVEGGDLSEEEIFSASEKELLGLLQGCSGGAY